MFLSRSFGRLYDRVAFLLGRPVKLDHFGMRDSRLSLITFSKSRGLVLATSTTAVGVHLTISARVLSLALLFVQCGLVIVSDAHAGGESLV